MSREFLLFCCACCILILTTINLSVGPIIKYKLWGTNNCAILDDGYDETEKNMNDDQKDRAKKSINECKNKKGFHDMEYTAFIFDIVIGFICGLLGLLHIFGVNTGFSQKTGLIGLICGIIGFILTFVYVIMNGIVFTSYNYKNLFEGDYSTDLYKRDSDGAYAELEETNNRYKCKYFDADDEYALYAKFSDLNQKQYNYDKDSYFETKNEITGCYYQDQYDWNNDGVPEDYSCNSNGYVTDLKYYNVGNKCKKLYIAPGTKISNKDLFDRFLTTLLLSLIVCVANIGLALFGFLLLFKSQSGSPRSEPTKVVKVEN